MNPSDMDGFMPLLSTTDIKTKMTVGNNLLNYLGDSSNSIECQDIGLFIDNVIPWLHNGNAKIVQNGLEILTYIADRMGHDFRPYISTIIQPTIDRLGDSKDLTREKARLALLKILERGSMTPQQLLDRLHQVFGHKNAKLREESLILLTTILAEYGADELSLSAVVPSIVKLLSDPNEKVRETAMNTIVHIYIHVGDRFRNDLQRNHNIPPAKWQLLNERFEQIKAEGGLLPLANSIDAAKEEDEPDRSIKSAPVKRVKSVLQKKSQFGPSMKSIPSSSGTSSGVAGAVDEESFITAFEDVPNIHLFSTKDLEEHFRMIREIIGDDKKDWNQRVDSLKKLRGIVISGGANYDTFMDLLKSTQNSFEGAITDLRSQVVKEACITLAHLSKQLKNKVALFIESLLGPLMNLIQNSAKVVSSSGAVALRFILQHTHSHRYIPIITTFLTSKSKDIRRAACEYLSLILQTWTTPYLQKHVKTLQEGIGKAIGDPDSEARAFARKAFWAFRDHFPEQGEILLNALDASQRRNLMSQSNSGSVNSLNAVSRTTSIPPRPARSATSAAGSTENLHQTQSPPHGPLKRTPSLPRSYRSGIPVLQRPTDNYCRTGPRSNSAIDLQQVRRAQSRMLYANMNRSKVTTPRANKQLTDVNTTPSPERTARTKTRVSGVSQSQPSSRSSSPASRMGYGLYNRDGESLIARPRRLSGQGMRSTETSREPSPQRFGLDRSITSKLRTRNMYMSPRPPVMAQKMLQQSREAESALADALSFDGVDHHHAKTPRGKGDQSDDSETSSLCSERSADNYRRASDSYSWSGSQQRLHRDVWDPRTPKDIKEIIEFCGRKHWGERKEGLMDLLHFLSNGNTLKASELRKITDIFTKMFMDSHTKVFTLFLDALNELILTHYEDLGDWLYVLCTRLLTKLGADLLASIQTKINRTLDVVRDSFKSEQLLPVIMRFITDPAYTPNSRVKVATLQFLMSIIDNAQPSALNPTCKSALVRLLDWTNDVKSQDVRRHAQEAIVGLYNLNPPLFPMMLNELPTMYHDIAMPLIQTSLKRSSPASNPASPSGLLPRVPQSPARHVKHHDIDSNNDDPEEVYKSLRRTTAEIQNYGFERMEGPTSSKDSGISNMAEIEDKIESLALNSGRSSSVSSPTQRGRNVCDLTIINGSSDTIAGDLILPDRRNNGYEVHNVSGTSPDLPRGPEVFTRTIETLKNESVESAEKIQALREFQVYIRDGDGITHVIPQFKKFLKTILACFASNDKVLEIEVLRTLIEMLKCRDLYDYFASFADLLTLKVLSEHKADAYDTASPRRATTTNLQLLKAAEDCAAIVATVLPPEKTIRLVLPTIKTEPFPKNVAAIKMIQNVVEHGGKQAIEPYLDEMMTALLMAYENPESVVRKAAVFCMVSIYWAVGEETFEPYRKNLYGGKLKLLNIYIQKAKEASQSSSPRSNHSRN